MPEDIQKWVKKSNVYLHCYIVGVHIIAGFDYDLFFFFFFIAPSLQQWQL